MLTSKLNLRWNLLLKMERRTEELENTNPFLTHQDCHLISRIYSMVNSFILRSLLQAFNFFFLPILGNKALGDNMNNFINENWEIIFQELKPAISDALGKVIMDIVANFFMNVPYNELFLE